ncbi:hypothetical protein ACF0H5_008741 [Mactra antiquata]
MGLSIVLIVIAYLISSCQCYVINQHQCEVKNDVLGLGLKCEIKGEGVYEADRLLSGVKSIKFWGNATNVTVKLLSNYTPDLKTVSLEGDSFVCASVMVEDEIKVYVNGKLCSVTRSTDTTTIQSSTPAKSTSEVFNEGNGDRSGYGEDRGKSGNDDNGGPTKGIVIIIVLSAVLSSIVLGIVCFKVCKCVRRRNRMRRLSLESEVIQFEIPMCKSD